MVSHVTEVAEGVHRLTNGVANFYLIQEPLAHFIAGSGPGGPDALTRRTHCLRVHAQVR